MYTCHVYSIAEIVTWPRRWAGSNQQPPYEETREDESQSECSVGTAVTPTCTHFHIWPWFLSSFGTNRLPAVWNWVLHWNEQFNPISPIIIMLIQALLHSDKNMADRHKCSTLQLPFGCLWDHKCKLGLIKVTFGLALQNYGSQWTFKTWPDLFVDLRPKHPGQSTALAACCFSKSVEQDFDLPFWIMHFIPASVFHFSVIWKW